MGVKHELFRQQLETRLEVPHLTLFTNGHLALEESIRAFGFPAGSEVITTPFTFASTTHAIVRNGLVPVFCDIRREDLTMDTSLIESLISEKTAAILPVHVYGNICGVEEIDRIAKRHNLKVIYDAAHAFGVLSSVIADLDMVLIMSVEPGFSGQGYIEGSEEKVAAVGGNAKMSEFQAAMGICNLRHIDEEIARRRAAADRYREHLQGVEGLRFPTPRKDVEPNYSYFPVLFEKYRFTRDEAFARLAEQGIFARKYFYPLTSDFDCYRTAADNCSFIGRYETPTARLAAEQVLTLPLYSEMTAEDVDRVCRVLLKG